MSEFILLFRGGDDKQQQQSPEKWQAQMQLWMKWMNELQQKGKLIGAQPLNETGKTIRSNKKIVSDGPFMEGKEMVGGYLLCKAENYEEAVSIAKDCPVLEAEDAVVEIREIKEIKM